MSNISFTSGTTRYLEMIRYTKEDTKVSSLSYRVQMMVDNLKSLYNDSDGHLSDGTAFDFNQYGFPDVRVEYLAHFGHGNFNVESACAEVNKMLYAIRSDTVYASILNECEYKTLILPKGFQIRLNDLNHNALNNTGCSYFTGTKEYRLNLDSITFYVSIHENGNYEIWPRVFCTYYEVDIRTNKLVPKYLRSIKIDSVMNYHIPSNLDLEYTTY